MEYLPTKIIRNNMVYVFIWCGNDDTEPDRILVQDDAVPYFSTTEDACRFAKAMGLQVNTNAVVHPIELDIISQWLQGIGVFHPEVCLNAWNVLLDFQDHKSIEWKKFENASERASQCHFRLSQCVINSQMSRTTSDLAATGDCDLAALRLVLNHGLIFFDSLVGL